MDALPDLFKLSFLLLPNTHRSNSCIALMRPNPPKNISTQSQLVHFLDCFSLKMDWYAYGMSPEGMLQLISHSNK